MSNSFSIYRQKCVQQIVVNVEFLLRYVFIFIDKNITLYFEKESSSSFVRLSRRLCLVGK